MSFLRENFGWLTDKIIPKDIDDKIRFRRVVENLGWLLSDRIFRLGLGMFITIWIARYLGPSEFGLLNYAIAFVAIISILSSLGMEQIVIRTIVISPGAKNEILGSAFLLRIIGSMAVVFLSFVLVIILRPSDSISHILILLISAGTIFQSFDVIDYWFQSQLKSKYTVYAKNTSFIIISALRVIFILSNFSIIFFAFAILVENIFGGLFLVLSYKYFGKEKIFKWKPEFLSSRKILKDSWPLILSSLAIMIYMRIDQVMLKEMVGDKSVGIYSAAVRIAEVWYFIPIALINSVFPVIVETKKKDLGLYNRRIAKLYSLLTWIGIIIAVFISIFSGTIINILYGSRFIGAESILSISIWAGIFVFQGVARGAWLVNENLQKYSYYYTLGACIVNIILNLSLIPIMQEKGAVIATLVSYFCSVILMPLFVKETRQSSIQLMKSFIWR